MKTSRKISDKGNITNTRDKGNSKNTRRVNNIENNPKLQKQINKISKKNPILAQAVASAISTTISDKSPPVRLSLSELFHIISTNPTLITQATPYCQKYYILYSLTEEQQLINYWIQIYCKEEFILISINSLFYTPIVLYNSHNSFIPSPEQILLKKATILNKINDEIKTSNKQLSDLMSDRWIIVSSNFSEIQKMAPKLNDAYKVLKTISGSGMPNIFKEIFESSLTIEDELFSLEKDKSMFSNVSTRLTSTTSLTLNNTGEAITISDLNSMDCYIANLLTTNQDLAVSANNTRIRYGIIRSTIDFFHDYVSEAVNIFEYFKAFIKQNNPLVKQQWINTVMDEIKGKVTTSGGNVNQTACKNLWSEYSIQYRKELNIPCFPIVDFGNIGSAKIWSDYDNRKSQYNPENYTVEFREIIDKLLHKLNIRYFYIEAQSTPISTALIQHKFGMVTSNIALRDAAPGVSITTAMGLGLENALWIDRIYDRDYRGLCPQVQLLKPLNQYSERRLITNGPSCLISKFLGLSQMKVNASLDSSQNQIESAVISGKSIEVRTSPTYPKINFLSLNGVIQSAKEETGLPIRQLRGQGTASKNPDIEVSVSSDGIEESMLILSLKTYTDYCQADEIEQLKTPTVATSVAHATPGLRVIAASSDFLASRTFSDFFATPSIYVGHNYVTVTCSDTRYETLDGLQIQQRLILYTQLVNNNDLLIGIIINKLNDYGRKYTTEQNFTASAPTYYGLSNLLLEMNQNIINIQQIIMDLVEQSTNFISLSYNEQVNFLKQFPSTLPEFLHSLCKFNIMYDLFKNVNYNFGKIVKKIRNIESRTTNAKFFEIYREIVQEITNALPTETTSDDLNIHIITLFTYSIATKPERIKTSFLTKLDLVKGELSDEQQQDTPNIAKILINIGKSIQFVFSVNQNIQQRFQSKKQLINAIKTIGNITESSQIQSEDIEKTDIDDKISDIENTMISNPSDHDIDRYNLIMEISQHTVILEKDEVDQGETIQLYFPYSELLLICQNIYTSSTNPSQTDIDNQTETIFSKLFQLLKTRGGRKTKKIIKNKRKTKKNIKREKINK